MRNLLRLVTLLLLVCLASSLRATDVYEGIVGPGKDPKEKERGVLLVTIRKLSDEESAALVKSCGGDLASVPMPKKASMPKPYYPYDMRRRGQTATVTCIVETSPDGKVQRIYRVGDDSDMFFTEVARSLIKAKLPKGEGTRYYRLVAQATATP